MDRIANYFCLKAVLRMDSNELKFTPNTKSPTILKNLDESLAICRIFFQ